MQASHASEDANNDTNDEGAGEGISKTRRKQNMHALQNIGAELVALSDEQISGMPLPERLREAVLEAKRLRPREALRRQMQFIGRLMRDIDPGPIRAQLDRWRGQSDAHTAQLHEIERWRDALIAGDPALERFLRAHPGADSQKLLALMRNARRERDAAQPPKSYRELFRVLRDILAEPAGPAADDIAADDIPADDSADGEKSDR